jgi:hypothetical protein
MGCRESHAVMIRWSPNRGSAGSGTHGRTTEAYLRGSLFPRETVIKQYAPGGLVRTAVYAGI